MARALVIEQRRAGQGEHRPHPLAAAGDQMAGELRDQRHFALHPVQDHRIDLVEVGGDELDDRIERRRGARTEGMDSRGHARGDARAGAQRQDSGRPGQLQPRQQAAQILALLERDRAAIDLRHVADDGETEAGARLAGVEPRAAIEDRLALALRNAGAVVLDLDLDAFGRRSTVTKTRPWPYLAAFSIRLPSSSSRSCRSTRASACLSPAMSIVTFS